MNEDNTQAQAEEDQAQENQASAPTVRPAIALVPVESNQVKAIGYDEATRTLAVQFKHGRGAIYHYPDVDKQVFDDLAAAESIGQFFGKHIKPLPFVKYEPEPVAEAAQAEPA